MVPYSTVYKENSLSIPSCQYLSLINICGMSVSKGEKPFLQATQLSNSVFCQANLEHISGIRIF